MQIHHNKLIIQRRKYILLNETMLGNFSVISKEQLFYMPRNVWKLHVNTTQAQDYINTLYSGEFFKRKPDDIGVTGYVSLQELYNV